MSVKSLKKFYVFFFVTTISISLLLFALNLYFSFTKASESIIFESILLVGLVVLLSFVFYLVYYSVLSPLSKLKNEMNSGLSSISIKAGASRDLSEIANCYSEIVSSLNATKNQLKSQTDELNDKNWELHEANTELEASYGQLQAIIEQLNEAEEKYHSLVRNIPEMVCVVDDNGMISFVNHVCADILGYEKSDIIGSNIIDLTDKRAFNIISIEDIKSRLKTKNTISLELTFIHKDGKSVITEANFTNYIYNGIDMGLQAIIRDITKRRTMEERIVQTNRELSIINTVSKSMTSTLDLDDLSNLIVNEITDKLDFDICALSLVENTGTSLTTKASAGAFCKGSNAFKGKSVSLDHEIIMSAFKSNQPVRKSHIPSEWPIGVKENSEADNLKISDALFVPFKVKDKKLGILTIGSSSPIKETDVNLLSYIGNNAAVAIDNSLLYESSKKYFVKTIDTLIATVEAKDSYTEGHSQRVSKYAVGIATKLGLDKDQIEDIKIAGILHDVGKIGISDTILQKPDKLTSEEYEVIKQHPLISNKILYPVGFSERTLKAIAFHHERFDGSGYPYGLAGDDISIEAQIISVADAFDAMTSSRSYRKAMNFNVALSEISKHKNSQFSPRVVDTLIEMVNSNTSF